MARSGIRRRAFIGSIGCLIAAPGSATAQPKRVPIVGVLGASTKENWRHWTEALTQRLTERGWIDGRTVTMEYRWADGKTERYGEIASELVRLGVDVIVTVGGAVPTVKQATSTIPIVFAISVDPVGSGLVASLARPGGNATGLSIQTTDLAGKRVELIKEEFPQVRRFAIFGNLDYSGVANEAREAQGAARNAGLAADLVDIRKTEDVRTQFAALNDAVKAIYVCSDPVMNASYSLVNDLALRAKLVTLHPFRDYLAGGGMMSYGANITDMFGRAAEYVDKILLGQKAGELPVQQPTRFELVVNLKTANALGVQLSPTLLARADEVIE